MLRMTPTRDIEVRDPTGLLLLGHIRRTTTGFRAEYAPAHVWFGTSEPYEPVAPLHTDSFLDAWTWLSGQDWPKTLVERGIPEPIWIDGGYRTYSIDGTPTAGRPDVIALALQEVPFGPYRAGVVLELPHKRPYPKLDVPTTIAWVIFRSDHRFTACIREVPRGFIHYSRQHIATEYPTRSGGKRAALHDAVQRTLVPGEGDSAHRAEWMKDVPDAVQTLLDMRAAAGISPLS